MGDKLERLPGSPGQLLTTPLLSWRGKLSFLAERFRRGHPQADESIDAFARRRAGSEVAEIFADALVTGIYAGDPSRGGKVLGEVTVPGPIPPSGSEAASVTLERLARDVTLYAVVDPLDAVLECNDANNLTMGPLLECAPIAE